MYDVYVLESEKNGRYYIGVSRNVRKRLNEHNGGFSKSTAPWRPWKLVRVETYRTIREAYQRERFLKSKKSKMIIRIIVQDSPDVRQRRSRDPDSQHQSGHRDSVG
ncbi:MAG: GIY-YIG nuclease family protein [Parcubacteria group bacterium]